MIILYMHINYYKHLSIIIHFKNCELSESILTKLMFDTWQYVWGGGGGGRFGGGFWNRTTQPGTRSEQLPLLLIAVATALSPA